MITKIKTDSREDWKALRQQYIGGSDAAAVVGLNAFVSPYALWAEKTMKVPPFGGNLATEVGSYLEEFVAQKWAEENGKKVQRCNLSLINDEYPFAIANIDRKVIGENAGLECKTTSALALGKFRDGEFPSNYYVQCMHYLAVTGYDRWYLACLIGNRDFKTFVIERDEGEIAALMKAEAEFYELIKNNEPPEADGCDSTGEALRTIYPESLPITVELFGMEKLLKEREEYEARIKEFEACVGGIDNQIKAAMGESERADCGGYTVSWKSGKRKSLDRKLIEKNYPQIDLTPCFTETGYRTFRVSKLQEVKI